MKTNKCLFMMTFATVLICGAVEGMGESPKIEITEPETLPTLMKLTSIDPEMSRRFEGTLDRKYMERVSESYVFKNTPTEFHPEIKRELAFRDTEGLRALRRVPEKRILEILEKLYYEDQERQGQKGCDKLH